MDSKTLRYNQPPQMTPVHYADDLYGKPCEVADVYDESTSHNILIEEVNPSVCHCL